VHSICRFLFKGGHAAPPGHSALLHMLLSHGHASMAKKYKFYCSTHGSLFRHKGIFSYKLFLQTCRVKTTGEDRVVSEDDHRWSYRKVPPPTHPAIGLLFTELQCRS
jgi:hypothetical protein